MIAESRDIGSKHRRFTNYITYNVDTDVATRLSETFQYLWIRYNKYSRMN